MKGPRGSLGSIFQDGTDIAESRLESVGQYLDAIASNDEPASGGVLSNSQLVALLRGSKEFAEQMAEKTPFMRPDERAKLTKLVNELLPTELPESNSAIPPPPWER